MVARTWTATALLLGIRPLSRICDHRLRWVSIQKPRSLVIDIDIRNQNDAQYLPEYGRMADLFRNPDQFKAGFDECHLPNWRSRQFPIRVSE